MSTPPHHSSEVVFNAPRPSRARRVQHDSGELWLVETFDARYRRWVWHGESACRTQAVAEAQRLSQQDY